MQLFKEKRHITRDNGDLYMTRWYILNFPLFGLKLHKIILSDHDCVHDHPWDFISIILKGGYVEHSEILCANGEAGILQSPESTEVIKKVSRIYHPGNILFRKAEHRHKLEIHQTCWTLVFTLKRRRKWGFWTSKGWIHWKSFISTQTCD